MVYMPPATIVNEIAVEETILTLSEGGAKVSIRNDIYSPSGDDGFYY